jgi:hypothetical protein
MPPATQPPGVPGPGEPEPGATGPTGGTVPPATGPVPAGSTAAGGRPAGTVGEPGEAPAVDPVPPGGTTAGQRVDLGPDDGDAITRRRRPAPRSRVPMLVAVGVFVALAIAGIVVGIATRDDGDGQTGSSSTTTGPGGQQANGFCATGRWPPIAQGQPESLGAAEETGYYVWNDAFGWHVRMVDTAATPGRFTGEVVSSANLTSSEVIPEGAGEVRVNGNTLTWDFPGSAEPQGFDVAVGGCAADTVRFTLSDADGPVPESRIFVGTNSTAVSNPLIVRRQG